MSQTVNTFLPLVSVVMTAHNAERFIEKAISSICNQTYQHIELLIVDDNSTDGTLQTIKRFKEIDRRIRVFRLDSRKGPAAAANIALKKARGQFIARMDADDISFPNRIEKQVTYLLRNPNTVLVGGQCRLIDGNGETIGYKQFPQTHDDIYRSLFIMNPVQHPACMINTRLLPRSMLCYSTQHVRAHDLDFVFKCMQYGKLANLADTILRYRQHRGSFSLSNPKQTFRDTIAVRYAAIVQYGYQPNWQNIAVQIVQACLVFILPSAVVYSLFCWWRLKSSIDMSIVSIRLGNIFQLTRESISFESYTPFLWRGGDYNG